jgi:serine/threonine protein kinase
MVFIIIQFLIRLHFYFCYFTVLGTSETHEFDTHPIIEIPKKSNLKKGLYQYVKMEYCSGGDLESIVRHVELLEILTVKSILFQMFFAFYTCRENLSMRHFDVKLLNFFVSVGGSLLTNSQKKEYEKIIVRNKIN